MSPRAYKCGEAWNLLLVHSNKGNAVARAEKAALRTPSCGAHFAASRCGNITHSVLRVAHLLVEVDSMASDFHQVAKIT
jgi:hypothetical protein